MDTFCYVIDMGNGDFRVEMLKTLPKGGVVAELGVLEGWLAAHILETIQPKKLHLVDCWVYQEDYPELGWKRSPKTNRPQEVQDDRYQYVLDRFSQQIDSGQVETHRAFTHEAVKQFSDGYFDWVYIDADHKYEAVLRDLNLYLPKLKSDGFFVGDDYVDVEYIGTVRAVKEFCQLHDFHVEVFPNPISTSNNANFILHRGN